MYICEICRQSYKTGSGLDSHMRTQHPTERQQQAKPLSQSEQDILNRALASVSSNRPPVAQKNPPPHGYNIPSAQSQVSGAMRSRPQQHNQNRSNPMAAPPSLFGQRPQLPQSGSAMGYPAQQLSSLQQGQHYPPQRNIQATYAPVGGAVRQQKSLNWEDDPLIASCIIRAQPQIGQPISRSGLENELSEYFYLGVPPSPSPSPIQRSSPPQSGGPIRRQAQHHHQSRYNPVSASINPASRNQPMRPRDPVAARLLANRPQSPQFDGARGNPAQQPVHHPPLPLLTDAKVDEVTLTTSAPTGYPGLESWFPKK
ncbi:hypothetical protein Xmau_00399 [Xenorhabdus mauleonii]|uniref:C2H2-type domain-containing protein n=1 Tax=Xenorhabdus mauleonii TaxID=351675 RepID=A0A1I3UD80_9GAMM|nr:C2H2-type zinc finger protein [Xenorhabdus mauleonii]PHM46006.1 hypothetical protein Xmau_00399 [Xenorhabdus mauleonii]SFJ80970.1 hypothetical protein SAMN05421680_116114 [Xenorhabdus mauleonii]